MAIAFVAASFTSVQAPTITVPTPSGTAAGHVLLAMITNQSGDKTIQTPSGWTHYASSPAAANRLRLYRRLAVAGEPSNHTWATQSSGSAQWSGTIVAYSGVDGVAPVDAISTADNTDVAPSLNTSRLGDQIIGFWRSAGSGAWTSFPAEMSVRVNFDASTEPDLLVADKYQGIIGASGTFAAAHSAVATEFASLSALRRANSAPNAPTSVTRTSAVEDTTPSLQCSVSDPDSPDETLKGRFEVLTSALVSLGTVDSAIRSGNGSVTADWPTVLDSGSYKLRAQAIDSIGAVGPFSGMVDFEIVTFERWGLVFI